MDEEEKTELYEKFCKKNNKKIIFFLIVVAFGFGTISLIGYIEKDWFLTLIAMIPLVMTIKFMFTDDKTKKT